MEHAIGNRQKANLLVIDFKIAFYVTNSALIRLTFN